MYKYAFRLPSYKLWEYEIDLAKREIQTLVSPNAQLEFTLGGFQIKQPLPIEIDKLKKLCFCHSVVITTEKENKIIDTQQAMAESSAKIADGVADFAELHTKVKTGTLILNGRKESKYGVHGLHKYKGKFYPQLIKSLINYSGVGPGSVFCDPFMGCGTAVIEGLLAGMVGIGIDLNPLAYFISKTRLSCLKLSPDSVEHEFNTLLTYLDKYLPNGDVVDGMNEAIVTELGMRLSLKYKLEDIEHLISWFPLPVLYKLFCITQAIECNLYTRNA